LPGGDAHRVPINDIEEELLSQPTSGIRLLACDMDGTLFRLDMVISEKVQKAIARAQQAGVLVILATGRMPIAARAFVSLLGLTGPQIYANGALVQAIDGKVVSHLPLPADVARDVVVYCATRGFHVNAYVGDDVVVTRLSPEAEFTRKLNRVNPVVIEDLTHFVQANEPTKMVIVRLPTVEPGLLQEVQEAFRDRSLVFSSVAQYIEMVNPLVDKGRALKNLATSLGLGLDQVAAIGDGDNDLTLLSTAGLPIAMGNGTAKLKGIARHVVGSVEEDGVAEAIDRYVLS
jgi:Cof subfamily protein (haloacid dehalogenase superfamily)